MDGVIDNALFQEMDAVRNEQIVLSLDYKILAVDNTFFPSKTKIPFDPIHLVSEEGSCAGGFPARILVCSNAEVSQRIVL